MPIANSEVKAMKIIFRDNSKSYLLIFILGMVAGLSVIFFYEIPNNDLWAFSYWSSKTFGFWMFSTSLIVLLSEKRKTAFINSTIYIFVMFFITTIHMTLRSYRNGDTPFHSLTELLLGHIYGWILYSLPIAIICGILGAILWSGRKNNIYGKALCVFPAIFILIETIPLSCDVLINHTKLFSALTNFIWLILYLLFLRIEVFNKRERK